MRIQNLENLISHGNKKGRSDMTELLEAGWSMINPYANAKRLISRSGNKLIFEGPEFELSGDPRSGRCEYDLNKFRRVIVVGAAKGVQQAALALEEILGDYLTGGHVIGKHGDEMLCRKIGVTLAGHPTPDIYCEEGCRKIYEWIHDVDERDFVITIAGSGVSSLLTWPVEGVSIQDMHDITYMMQIENGAWTKDLNPIRNLLDRYKGGKLSRIMQKATMVHFATHDLGGGSMTPPGTRSSYSEIMSQNFVVPTLPDSSTSAKAIASFKKYDVWDRVPLHIKEYFLKGDLKEASLKIDEYEKMNARLFKLTSKLGMVYPAIMKRARELGYEPLMLAETLAAEAAETGKVFGSIAMNIQNMNQPVKAPCVLISSGELVVTVGDSKGIGGRNQEFCVAAAQRIAGSSRIVIGAVDTDGTDGPGGLIETGAPGCLAGAIVDGHTLAEAAEKGLDLMEALKSHAVSSPLWKLQSGVHATNGISALDLRIILVA